MGLQEPVNNEESIVKFCKETGLPVALDETINSVRKNSLEALQKYIHSGVAAVVSILSLKLNLFMLHIDFSKFYEFMSGLRLSNRALLEVLKTLHLLHDGLSSRER